MLSKTALKAGEPLDVTVDVRNSGSRDGDEVVQLYVSRQAEGAPIRSLKGFQRVHLKAGETKKVSFRLDAQALSIVDARGTRLVPVGTAQLWVGGGQPGGVRPASGVAATVKVLGQKVLKPF